LYIFIVKFLGWLLKSRQEQVAAPAPPTRDQELLMEIRDLLKQQTAAPAAGDGSTTSEPRSPTLA
jgi:large conductance mechanosensitive channel